MLAAPGRSRETRRQPRRRFLQPSRSIEPVNLTDRLIGFTAGTHFWRQWRELPKVEVSRVIRAPRGKVWEVAANPELMTEWWPGGGSVEILSREGNTITIRGTQTQGGREVSMTEKWTLHPPEKIEIEFLEGPIRGKSIETFEEVSEGTKVNWSSDIRFKGVLGSVMGRLLWSRFKGSIGQPLENLAKYIEAQ